MLEISGGLDQCRILRVASLMRYQDGMNLKFWLRAFSNIVVRRPELRLNLPFDPLEALDGFFEAVWGCQCQILN